MEGSRNQFDEDKTSFCVDASCYDTQGFSENYTLRRHHHEIEADRGSQEARSDWIKYIGPVQEFGGCNPYRGNFTSLVLPLCLPERIRLVAYILECEWIGFYSFHSNTKQ